MSSNRPPAALESLVEYGQPRARALLALARILGHYGIFVGLGAAGVAVSSALILGGEPRPTLVLTFLCVVGSSYGIDRIVDVHRDSKHRAQALANVPWFAGACALGLLASATIGATSQQPTLGLLALAFPLSVTLYVVPWMHRICPPLGRRGIRRIKDIPLAKAFYVAAVWSSLVLWTVPFYRTATLARAACAALFVFVFIFIDTVGCDLRDEARDRTAGVLTFPALLGRQRTISMLRGVYVMASIGFIVAVLVGIAPSVMLPLTIAGIPTGLCIELMKRPDADLDLYGDVILDVAVAVQPVLALLMIR